MTSSLAAVNASTGSMTSADSRCSITRFLRTSTWIVRALPVLSVFLISVLDLRVYVI